MLGPDSLTCANSKLLSYREGNKDCFKQKHYLACLYTNFIGATFKCQAAELWRGQYGLFQAKTQFIITWCVYVKIYWATFKQAVYILM